MKLMKVMAGGDFFILAARVELSFPAVNQLFFNLNETKVTQNSKAAKIKKYSILEVLVVGQTQASSNNCGPRTLVS